MRLPPKQVRPPFSNQPPREAMPSGEVSAAYGKAHFTGPAWVFVALLIFGLVGTIVYLATRQTEDPSGMARDVRNQLASETEAMRELREALTHRLDGLETKVDRLQDSQDRVRERVTTLENRH